MKRRKKKQKASTTNKGLLETVSRKQGTARSLFTVEGITECFHAADPAAGCE